MSRLPFDPKKLPDRDAGPPAQRDRARYGEFDQPEPLSVTQLTTLIKRVIADRTPSPVRVVGEISNFSDRKHWYLSLKDDANVISCVMWASAAGRCGFTPDRGQQVVATGRLDYYGPQGRLQMYIDQLEPVGQGALELRFRQLCEELRKLGYFDDAHKRPPPSFPQHIAVVTSAGGAALHDVVNTAHHRWPGVKLSLVDVRVQGDEAAQQIADAIDSLSAHHAALGIDAIILTRGGGSMEDLWAFNERIVAEAVYRCQLFVAAAIGHETDTTVAELVADLRCSTPTQAAARLVPDAAAEHHRIQQYAHRLRTALRRRVENARARWQTVAMHPLFRKPTETIDRHRQMLRHLEHRLGAAAKHRVADARDRLQTARHDLLCHDPANRARLARRELDEATRQLQNHLRQRLASERQHLHALQRQLQAVGPDSVLSRGYSYTTDEQGQVLRSVEQTQPGQSVLTHLADGKFRSTVTPPTGPPTSPPPAKPAAKRKSRRRAAETSQPKLFDELDS
ncbi:MAG: exodeoxyribonuclease VII large subunit [Phycisphaeraceae bacterium]